MRGSSSYWLAAYIVSMIVVLAVTIAYVLRTAPEKTCPSVNLPGVVVGSLT